MKTIDGNYKIFCLISWIFEFFIFLNVSDFIRFVKLNEKHCWGGSYGSYLTLQAAIDDCEGDSNCGGVYDQGCDAGYKDIFLCESSTNYASSGDSCIYEKTEIGE